LEQEQWPRIPRVVMRDAAGSAVTSPASIDCEWSVTRARGDLLVLSVSVETRRHSRESQNDVAEGSRVVLQQCASMHLQ